MVHPDTSSLKQTTFYVTNHECSVDLSCKTSLRLNLIHPCSNLDQIPDSASLIYSNTDHPMKRKSKNSAQERYVNQCVRDKVPVQDETRKQECQANVEEGDKNCQVNMQPVQSANKESSHMETMQRPAKL